ncbi:putative sugar phosphate/phosphate translocator [Iris pallida]|uniref:Sugar phosphate/phosphate translocator n=1 Tax=Iris pallida TaxID=29817 RepID=A0AAX6HEX5_IRIPA|nr:putative sugar phosphate/phosphate translocator [Iris pallida]
MEMNPFMSSDGEDVPKCLLQSFEPGRRSSISPKVTWNRSGRMREPQRPMTNSHVTFFEDTLPCTKCPASYA